MTKSGITIDIPGFGELKLHYLVMDYNGTLAVDGSMIPGVKELLAELSPVLRLYVITADTFGSAAKNLQDVDCDLKILRSSNQQAEKAEFVGSLGRHSVVAVGNGLNDALMLKNAALGISLIQKEGASSKTIINSDIVCTGVIDALELLKNPRRLTATLRK